jgi:hypothetical protein
VTLVKFNDFSGAEVYVNPNLVTFIRVGSDAEFTTIHFSEDHSVNVKGTTAGVASKLINVGQL